MLKTKLIAGTMLAAFIVAPTFVFAGEESPKISYSAKKQGRVHFQDKTQSNASAAQDTTSADFHPADIEPAAGDAMSDSMMEENSLANSMKLPRK